MKKSLLSTSFRSLSIFLFFFSSLTSSLPSLSPSFSLSLFFPLSLLPSFPHSLSHSILSLPPPSPSPSQPSCDILQHLEGQHTWFSCSHHKRTFCNVCREPLHGMAWHGLSCEVCKMKSHRRCVFQLKEKCKWTTRSSLEQANVKIEQDVSCRYSSIAPTVEYRPPPLSLSLSLSLSPSLSPSPPLNSTLYPICGRRETCPPGQSAVCVCVPVGVCFGCKTFAACGASGR